MTIRFIDGKHCTGSYIKELTGLYLSGEMDAKVEYDRLICEGFPLRDIEESIIKSLVLKVFLQICLQSLRGLRG